MAQEVEYQVCMKILDLHAIEAQTQWHIPVSQAPGKKIRSYIRSVDYISQSGIHEIWSHKEMKGGKKEKKKRKAKIKKSTITSNCHIINN